MINSNISIYDQIRINNANNLFNRAETENLHKESKSNTLIKLFNYLINIIPNYKAKNRFIKDFKAEILSLDSKKFVGSNQEIIDQCEPTLKRLNSLQAIHSLITKKNGYTLSDNFQKQINEQINRTHSQLNQAIHALETEKTSRELEQVEQVKIEKTTVNQPSPSLAGRAWEMTKTVTGITDMGASITDLRNGNYKNSLYNFTSGSLKMIATAAITYYGIQTAVSYLTPAVNYAPINNDVCQTPGMTNVCTGTLGIPRIQMPQVEGEVKEIFLKNIPSIVSHTKVAASKLIPVQNEMNFEKVMGMVNAYKAGTYNPCNGEILVAQNEYGQLYVIDGHHRYAACRLINGTQKIIKIMSRVPNLLVYLNSIEGVTKANL